MLTMATDNAYTGETRINAGTVIVAADGALGASYVALGGTEAPSDASLLVAGAFTMGRNIAVQDDGSGSSALTLGGTNTSGTATFLGDITLYADLALTAEGGGTVRLTGLLDNWGGKTLIKVGDGTVVFDGFQIHGPGALLDVRDGTVFLNTDAGSDTAAYLSISVADAELYFGSNQHLDTLTIGDDGLVRFTGANTVVVKHLVMDGIDLGPATLTPEPAALSLLAFGSLLLLRRRRK
jgi:autotransporter-associated beta strand protein